MLGRGFRKTVTTATVRRHFAADAKIVEKRTSPNYRYREVDVVGKFFPV